MGIQVCFQGHWYGRDGTEECRLRADVREPVLPEERDMLEELPRDACADLDSDRGISDRLIVGRKRSEEHTSELQSRLHLVCRLLLEKKKKLQLYHYTHNDTQLPIL